MTDEQQTAWTRRRKHALDVRDALDAAIKTFSAAGLPTDALERVRETAQSAYLRWLERPDLLPDEERDAILAELRGGLDQLARMLPLLRSVEA